MAENKKISELDQIQSLSNDDEFMVVDKSTTSGEDASSSGKTTRVTLNQLKEAVSASGAKGERGAQGARGATGSAGSNGATGAQGATGARGATGSQGQKGQAGSNGATGATGQKGQAGSNGSQGATGSRGATGSQGQKGVPGASIRGATGSSGARGATGSSGANGAKGQKGQAGSTGARGATGSQGQRGLTGVGQKGQKGLTGVGQKGAAGSTASITTSTTITPGQIRFNNNTNSRLDDEGSWGFRSRTNSGYIQFGPGSASHAHIYTDRANFYFNKELLVNGKTVYHSGNLSAVRKSFPGAGSTGHYGLDGWLDFSSSSNYGIYWSKGTGKGWHIYPQATANMYIRSGSTTGSFKFTCNNATVQAHLYWNTSQELGFLSNSGNWRLRSRLNNTYGPNLWFQGQATWSGDAGVNQGKIEYHSNRFYINAGSNSTSIVQFRRGGTNVSYISNSGQYVGGLYVPRVDNVREGGEITLQASDGQEMAIDQFDHNTPGFRHTYRFFDKKPHTKVFAQIGEGGTLIHGGLHVDQDLSVNGDVTIKGTVTDSGAMARNQVDKFPEGLFNYSRINTRGHAFLDKTNTVRFTGTHHHNRQSTGTFHHTYGNWIDVNIPNDHDKVDDPIEQFHLGRHEIYVITKKGVGYASGYNGNRSLATEPGNYRGKVQNIPGSANAPMRRIQHDAPLRSISFSHYQTSNVWMLDTNNKLWGAGYNLRGTLNQGNGHKTSWNTTHNSGTTLNSSGQLIKVMDNVKEAYLVGYENNETGYIIGTNKKMYTLGYNAYGELGHGNKTTNNTFKAKQVTLNNFGNENVKSFTISSDHHTKTVYVITENNQLWGWGYNGLYQLGLNHTNSTTTPTILFGGRKVKRVWATRGHYGSAFLQDEDNNIWACGANGTGQCGVGTTSHLKVWTRVPSLDIVKNSIIDIKTDGDNGQHTSVHVLATYNGRNQIFNCGYNGVGQLGQGHYTNIKTFQRMPYGPRNIVDFYISHGENSWEQVLFLKDDSSNIWITGACHYYMTGDPGSGNNQPRYNTPVRLPIR